MSSNPAKPVDEDEVASRPAALGRAHALASAPRDGVAPADVYGDALPSTLSLRRIDDILATLAGHWRATPIDSE